jgi:predicted RNA-binding Zn-ribbon protein involved in translation (DUF1610 family)
MNVNSRIAKLERDMKVGGRYCPCGTSWMTLNEERRELTVIHDCPDCGLPIRKETFAEMAVRADREIANEI